MRMMRTGVLAPALILCSRAVLAEAVEDPNYTTQNLLIFNDQCEVLLQRNFMGWSTPGVRYDQRLTLGEGLAELAGRYGMQIRDTRLAGLFSYRYGYTPAISTRSHYSATLAGGQARAPEGFAEVKWFGRDAAVAAIASDTQKSPPALVELMGRMLQQPETIWGGAFYIWQEGEIYKSKVLEPFQVLGRADGHCAAAGKRSRRGR